MGQKTQKMPGRHVVILSDIAGDREQLGERW